MKNTKSIAQRLMVLYVTFILVIALSLVAKIIPDSKMGYNAGIAMRDMIVNSDQDQKIYMLPSINYEPFENEAQLDQLNIANTTTQVRIYNESATFIVSEISEEGTKALSSIGGSSVYYYTNILYIAIFIWMLVLIARIILSLRRSMIDQTPVCRSNVLRVRLIGSIVIATELINATATWSVQRKAAEVLSGSGFNIDTAFTPDYWLIMLGILVLFMGELFAVAHSLSEEQKFTI